jgi:signal peptidase I
MLPLVGLDDVVFVSPRTSDLRAGDVVLVDQPDGQTRTLLRVVATAGQRVRYAAGGTLYVDGQAANDAPDGEIKVRPDDHEAKPPPEHARTRYIETLGVLRHPIVVQEKAKQQAASEVTLAADQLYLLGDDRDNGIDSRTIGPVPRSRVHGEALFVFMAGPYVEGPGRIWTRLSAAPR